MKKVHAWVPAFLLAISVPALAARKDFSFNVVDGLGRPLQNVAVEITWKMPNGTQKVRPISTLKLNSDNIGRVRGSYDDQIVAAGGLASVSLNKKGYVSMRDVTVIGPVPFDSEYKLAREFHTADLLRIANLDPKAATSEMKELLAGELKEAPLETKVFELDHLFRPALRSLAQDPDVGLGATSLLSLIGVPDDLAWIIKHPPAARTAGAADAWASEVVSAMLAPSSDAEWEFLKKCADGNFGSPTKEAAIIALRLIASPKVGAFSKH